MSDTKFKVGDKVRVIRRTHGYTGEFEVGSVGIIKRFQSDDDRYAVLTGDTSYSDSCWHSVGNIELVEEGEDRSKWHKHHDLITAWAKGAEIEYYSKLHNTWEAVIGNEPSWLENVEYRIKPEPPKSDKERIKELEARVAELESKNGW